MWDKGNLPFKEQLHTNTCAHTHAHTPAHTHTHYKKQTIPGEQARSVQSPHSSCLRTS
jgi:hypothetical protein